jgi:ElaB/YqjD/DUF883 family membrane-anchored ribosome-binding protein
MAFQEALRKLRKFDDNIIYSLNTSIRTESFLEKSKQSEPVERCKQLWNDITKTYDQREKVIKSCVQISSEKVKELRAAREAKPDDIQLLKQLKNEQTQLRLLQSELGVEEVIRDRTVKVFHERCRNYYSPAL